MLTKTAYGQQNVEDIHKLIGGIQGVRTYLGRFTTEHKLTEYWNCVIDGHLQQGIDVFELDAQGRVVNQTVWLRPWPNGVKLSLQGVGSPAWQGQDSRW
jgi:hypothetical protein